MCRTSVRGSMDGNDGATITQSHLLMAPFPSLGCEIHAALLGNLLQLPKQLGALHL